MRKLDYEVLAATIKRQRDRALTNCQYHFNTTDNKPIVAAIEAIAGTFSHFASVDKRKFLIACGIDPD